MAFIQHGEKHVVYLHSIDLLHLMCLIAITPCPSTFIQVMFSTKCLKQTFTQLSYCTAAALSDPQEAVKPSTSFRELKGLVLSRKGEKLLLNLSLV